MTSLSGARPTLTIWLGSATIRPANGPDSKVSSAANPLPEAICSTGTAWSDTVSLESDGFSECCQAGMIEVASSKVSGWAEAGGALPGDVLPGQRTIVEVTEAGVGSGSGGGSDSAAITAGSGSGLVSGMVSCQDLSTAATGSGSGLVSGMVSCQDLSTAATGP